VQRRERSGRDAREADAGERHPAAVDRDPELDEPLVDRGGVAVARDRQQVWGERPPQLDRTVHVVGRAERRHVPSDDEDVDLAHLEDSALNGVEPVVDVDDVRDPHPATLLGAAWEMRPPRARAAGRLQGFPRGPGPR